MTAAPSTSEALAALLGGKSEHLALVGPDGGQRLSYAEAAERIDLLAGRLATAGIRRGDRVALSLYTGVGFREDPAGLSVLTAGL